MYTGVDPSHHGVFDFFDYEGTYPDEATVVTGRDVHAPSMWEYLTQQELRSIVLNVPVTHPANELVGIQIPGYLAPSDEPGYPPEIREELGDTLGSPYRIYSEYENDDRTETKIEGYKSLIEKRGIAAAHLLETREWDFAFVQVQKTDAVFHNSSSTEHFETIYRTADELVGRLIEASPENLNVILCSDHGMGPVGGYTVYINELLKEAGYIETTTGRTARSISTVKGEESTETDAQGPITQVVSLGRKMGLGPERVYQLAKRFAVSGQLRQLVPDSLEQSLKQGVDWRQSTAYCRRPSEQGIRLNVRGREPEGIVPPESYESVRSEIIEYLSDLTTDSGGPVFDFVCRREEIYDGPYTEQACDILFKTAGMNHKISTALPGIRMTSVETHNHKSNGVFVASGPEINAEWTGTPLSVVDIAPLVFTLLEQPIPERLTGDVPSDLTALASSHESYDVTSVDEGEYIQDQSEVTDRLRDLGYL
jgi:predicted AlkP superfamily phosphohydrolase/phosphomutase